MRPTTFYRRENHGHYQSASACTDATVVAAADADDTFARAVTDAKALAALNQLAHAESR